MSQQVLGVISVIPMGWGVCGSVMHRLCPVIRLKQQDQAVILGSVFMEMERSHVLTGETQQAWKLHS